MMQDHTVFVVDDDPAVLDSLHWLLDSAGLKTELFASADEFLAAYDPGRPGCLLLDVRLVGMSGPELQLRLREQHANLPVIILTGHADVPTAVAAMRAGAVDFIEKPYNDAQLLESIRFAFEQAMRSRSDVEERKNIQAALKTLTPRESQVLDLVVRGLGNKQIAWRLGVTKKTVEVHRSRVMGKMEANSLPALVRMWLIGCGDEA